MNTMNRAASFTVLAAALVMSAGATTYSWNTSPEDPAGVVTNASHFFSGAAPAALADITPADTVNILTSSEANGEKTLSMPAGADYSGAWYPVFHAYDNRPVTYDGPGKWRQPDLDSSAAVKYGASAHFALQSWASSFLSVGGNTTSGTFLLDNAKFRIVRNPTDGSPSFDLDRGTMDFYTPNGKEQTGTYLYTAANTYPKTRFAFHAGSCFRAPIMHVYTRCATNEIVFDGGDGHYIRNFQLRRNDAPVGSVADRTRLVVTGADTKLTLGVFGYTGSNEHTYRVDVRDGATLAISNANESVTQIEGASDVIALSGGGTLLLGDGTHALSWRNANFVATNGVVDTTATGAESFSLTGVGNARLKDSVWRSGNININGNGTMLRFVGGSFAASGLFVANESGGGSASFVADGGSHAIANVYLSEKSGSDATLRVQNGASLEVGTSLYVGRAVDAAATVRVAGGSLDVGDLIVVGGSGSADVEVSAGTVTCRRVGFVWNNAGRNSVNVLRMAGGEMRVSDSVALVAAGDSAGCSATVVLDGGVLSVGSMAGSAGCSAVNASKTGTAKLAGNGGTLRAASANVNFLRNLNSATCGSKGLAIESDYDITIAQGFSDAAGETGELILTGSGAKTLSGASTVSRIVAAGGTVVFADGATASGTLVVTNGAKVVFTGDPGDVGLNGLVLGDSSTSGVLSLSAGQTLAVGGDVVVNSAKVELVGEFAFGSTNALLTATGVVSGESAAAWADALISSGAVEAYSYDFLVSSDGGVTSLKMGVGDAAFRIVQETGTRDYSSAVELGASAKAFVAVSNAATLAMSGKVARGAVKKVGEGKFYLTNPGNVLLGGIVSEAGLFSVPTAAALGFGGGLDVFALRGGTLEFTSTSPESLPGSIIVDAGSKTAAVVRNAGDLVVAGLSLESGDLVKRGAGRLVVDSTGGGEVTLTRDDGTSTNGWDPSTHAADLNDSGIAPTTGYMGLNVAEGALVLKGDASATFDAPNCVMVGMRTSEGVAQPELVVDGAKANLATSGLFQFCGYQTASTAALRPRFTLVNGADVSVATFMVGRGQDYAVTTWPTTTVDNATLSVSSFRGGYHGMCNHGIVMRNGARLYATAMLHYGPTYFDVANSAVQKNAAGDCTAVSFNDKAGEWTFRDGSYLALNKMSTTKTSAADAFTINFDGGTWETGGGDYQTFHLCNAEMFIIRATGSGGLTLPVAHGKTVNVARAISGDGPIVKTGAGTLVFETQGTWDSALTTKTPLEDGVSLATTGLLDVREGSVSIHAGACRSGGSYRAAQGSSVDFCGNSVGAASFSGAGEFAAATVSGGKIVVPLSDDGSAEAAPVFSSMAFSGGVKVDFGRDTPPDGPAEGLVVATFPDGAPDVSGWRSRNTGKGTRATFRVAANGKDVLADIKTTGFILILR